MALLFRKFIVPGFNRRFEDKRFDYDSNMQTEGYYRSAFRLFIKLGQELKAGKFDDKITDVLENVAKEISAKY